MSAEWNKLLVKYLGGKVKGRTAKIRNDILVVDRLLKPGYLVDFPVNSAEKLIKLLEELSASHLTNSNLVLLVLDFDYIIFNSEYYTQFSEGTVLQTLQFIDVSSCLATPRSMTDGAEMFKNILKTVVSDCRAKLQTLDCSDSNLTTMFGILVGYPVVYWYSTQDGKLDNCLSMEPLKHVEVTGLDSNGTSFTIYSFSFPDCLSLELQGHVQKWYDTWRFENKWTGLFTSVNIAIKVVSLPAVNL